MQVAEFLIKAGVDVERSHALCAKSESDKIIEMTQQLIVNGVDVNQTDEKGRSAADNFTSPLRSLSEPHTRYTVLELLQQKQPADAGINQQQQHATEILKNGESTCLRDDIQVLIILF